MVRTLFISLIGLFPSALLQAQGSELKLGLVVNFGTHQQELGLRAGAAAWGDGFRANLNAGIHYHFKEMGKSGKYLGTDIGCGFSYGWSGDHGSSDYTYSDYSVTNVAPFQGMHAAIGYRWYMNRKGTAQVTGSIRIQSNSLFLEHENDLFSGTGSDKFRTGSLRIGHYVEDQLFAINVIMWHGNTRGIGRALVEDDNYPARHGYINMSETRLGKLNHGIFSVEWAKNWEYKQQSSARLGVDAEQIRHSLQNKLIHDAPWWPADWRTPKNPHIPMLQANGQPYLFKEGTNVRPPLFYLQLALNALSYY